MSHRPTPLRIVGVAVSAALAVLLSCCAGCSGRARDPWRTPPDTRQDLAPQQPVGPFDGLASQSAAVQTRLQNTQNALTAQCMHRRGFRYTVPVLREPGWNRRDRRAPTIWLSPETAAVQGYGIADNVAIDRANDAAVQRPQPDAHRPGYGAALTGTAPHRTTVRLDGGSSATFNSDGCTTWSLVHLYGPRWNEVYFDVSGLSAKVQQQVTASPEWQAAVRRWSACMSTRYHVRYSSPQAARADVAATVATVKDTTSPAAQRRLRADRWRRGGSRRAGRRLSAAIGPRGGQRTRPEPAAGPGHDALPGAPAPVPVGAGPRAQPHIAREVASGSRSSTACPRCIGSPSAPAVGTARS